MLKQPTGGALRYRVPRLAPVILTFGVIAGLRSLHPGTRREGGARPSRRPRSGCRRSHSVSRTAHYVDDHLAIFMPYIWVDDPIAFASGREVYGFAKTQGWMRRLPTRARIARTTAGRPIRLRSWRSTSTAPPSMGRASELGRTRLITIEASGARRGDGRDRRPREDAAGVDFEGLTRHFRSEFEPGAELVAATGARRSMLTRRVAAARSGAAALGS